MRPARHPSRRLRVKSWARCRAVGWIVHVPEIKAGLIVPTEVPGDVVAVVGMGIG